MSCKYGMLNIFMNLLKKGPAFRLNSCQKPTSSRIRTSSSSRKNTNRVSLIEMRTPTHTPSEKDSTEFNKEDNDDEQSITEEDELSLLQLAALYNRPNIVSLLIGSGCDINEKNEKTGLFSKLRQLQLFLGVFTD